MVGGQARRDGEPLHLLVDSTGLKLCGAGEWLVEKHGAKTRRSWRTWYSPLAILTALTLRAVFHLALRQTEA